MSLPYLLLSIFPSAVKALPRPGRWMETFRQVMAFPLYATVAYLIWVLAGQTTEDGLLNAGLGLVLIAMGAWAYGRWSLPSASTSLRFAGIALVALVAAGAWLGWPRHASTAARAGSPAAVVWDKWSPETIDQLRAQNRIIYVDFTARWCATCQANKKLVFHSNDVLKTFARKKRRHPPRRLDQQGPGHHRPSWRAITGARSRSTSSTSRARPNRRSCPRFSRPTSS